ncbi:MAG TPA: alkaline phosphatase family protein [Streptosporangiaceae bacterium]
MAGHPRWTRTRRLAALLAAGATALAVLAMAGTASARPAIAGRPARTPIRHIVVLYLENQTFDSVLGYWCHQHKRRCPAGGLPAAVRLSDGAVVTPRGLPDIVPDVAHGVAPQAKAIDGGRMDGWQKLAGCGRSSRYACIGGYKPAQVPNLTRLAQRFAISDRTFSMAASPSWGGHLYAVTDTLDGFLGANPHTVPGVPGRPGWGCDSSKVSPWVSPRGVIRQEPSCVPDYGLGLAHGGAFRATPVKHVPTILDRLSAAGLSWALFGEPTPPAKAAGASSSDPSAAPRAGYVWDICPSFAGCLYSKQKANNVLSSTFVSVARAGKLPNFSLITPGGVDVPFSEHNGFSMTAGDDWLGRVASAVMNGPQWRSTALFITWDDCGCFYDQVRPGTNPDGTAQGPRTPLIIVSPYARASFTDTRATTFAGILAFTEHTFGLQPLGRNDRLTYAFAGAFNYRQAPLPPARMVYRPWPPDAYHVNMKEAQQDT